MKATLTSITLLGITTEKCELTTGNSSQHAIITAPKFYIALRKTARQFYIQASSDDATIGLSLYVDEIDDQRGK